MMMNNDDFFVEFDESVTRGGAARPKLPQGYYLSEVVDWELTAPDYPKTKGMYLTTRIVEGKAGVGFKFRDYNTFKPDAQFGFGGILKALGLQQTADQLKGRKLSRSQAQALMDQLNQRTHGKRLVVLITDQDGTQGRKFSGIDAYHSPDEWSALQNVGVSASNGTEQGPAGGGGTITDLDVPF